MSGRPQPTKTLIRRLFRMGRSLRKQAEETGGDKGLRAWANLCDQAAGRLDDLQSYVECAAVIQGNIRTGHESSVLDELSMSAQAMLRQHGGEQP